MITSFDALWIIVVIYTLFCVGLLAVISFYRKRDEKRLWALPPDELERELKRRREEMMDE